MSQEFPGLTEEDVHQLVPLKEDVAAMKLYCGKGEGTLVYLVSELNFFSPVNIHHLFFQFFLHFAFQAQVSF